jgi:hypothetical protein
MDDWCVCNSELAGTVDLDHAQACTLVDQILMLADIWYIFFIGRKV